jgi:hypothetical protein
MCRLTVVWPSLLVVLLLVGFVPAREHAQWVVHAELIYRDPIGARQAPPSWNPNLPKLAGDRTFLYAVHTHFDGKDGDYAVIMQRPQGIPGAWTIAATLQHIHQHPGIIMDAVGRLHLVFACQKPSSGVEVECFQGGVRTYGLQRRFYHLVFSSHNPDSSLRFDTYSNYSEWNTLTNGYLGLATASDGTTWWSLADGSWQRQLQWWKSGAEYGTLSPLSVLPFYLLYPVHASDPVQGIDKSILFAGVYAPSSSTMTYPASMAYADSARVALLPLTRVPGAHPGPLRAFPDDVAYHPNGTSTHLLLYRPHPLPSNVTTDLALYDANLTALPVISSVGTPGLYAKLQIARDGTFFVLATTTSGPSMTLGTSTTGGATWTWQNVSIQGLPLNEDQQYYGMTPIKPYTSPLIYEHDRFVFFFSGDDGTGLARHSYLGSITLR